VYSEGQETLTKYPLLSVKEADVLLKPYLDKTFEKIKANRRTRNAYLTQYPPKKTELYVIVATGNIHEDVIQAVSAAKAGADIIAVIRTRINLFGLRSLWINNRRIGGT
jgi:beta-lysine 5,6-aminomutase alpha subunit